MRNKAKRFNYDSKLLGERVAKYRTEASLTQEQLAEKLDMSVASVSHIENGKVVCDLNVLIGLANAFNTDLSVLLYGIALNGISAESYLTQEIAADFACLTVSEKRLVQGFIKLLLQEQQRGFSDDDI